jgi:hypothetical protein
MQNMASIFRAFFILISTGALVVAFGYGQVKSRKVCTDDELKRALDESDTLKDWKAVYRSFKSFGHCDTGAVSEGYDDSAIRLLTKDWKHVVVLSQLGSADREFGKFVLRHISELASEDELQVISKNAKSSCPSGEASFCQRIVNRIVQCSVIDRERWRR